MARVIRDRLANNILIGHRSKLRWAPFQPRTYWVWIINRLYYETVLSVGRIAKDVGRSRNFVEAVIMDREEWEARKENERAEKCAG